jgi:hypothetical protein
MNDWGYCQPLDFDRRIWSWVGSVIQLEIAKGRLVLVKEYPSMVMKTRQLLLTTIYI